VMPVTVPSILLRALSFMPLIVPDPGAAAGRQDRPRRDKLDS
jgi:hypothetical protein